MFKLGWNVFVLGVPPKHRTETEVSNSVTIMNANKNLSSYFVDKFKLVTNHATKLNNIINLISIFGTRGSRHHHHPSYNTDSKVRVKI